MEWQNNDTTNRTWHPCCVFSVVCLGLAVVGAVALLAIIEGSIVLPFILAVASIFQLALATCWGCGLLESRSRLPSARESNSSQSLTRMGVASHRTGSNPASTNTPTLFRYSAPAFGAQASLWELVSGPDVEARLAARNEVQCTFCPQFLPTLLPSRTRRGKHALKNKTCLNSKKKFEEENAKHALQGMWHPRSGRGNPAIEKRSAALEAIASSTAETISAGGEICAVCLDELTGSEAPGRVVQLPCSHQASRDLHPQPPGRLAQ